jgi:uncharacterized protein with PQ loop repeat
MWWTILGIAAASLTMFGFVPQIINVENVGSPIKRHLSREKNSPQVRRSVFFEEKMRLREWALL